MKFYVIAVAGLCLAQPALAASPPPETVIMGTVAAAGASGTGHGCTTNAGPAMFQRRAATAAQPNPTAILDLPSVAVSQQFPPSGLSLTGTLLLRFTSATAGKAQFDYDQSTINSNLPLGQTVPFSNYKQVWTPSSATLKVTFDINFPNCSLPVLTLFRSIP